VRRDGQLDLELVVAQPLDGIVSDSEPISFSVRIVRSHRLSSVPVSRTSCPRDPNKSQQGCDAPIDIDLEAFLLCR
jgi:hypothetical protein